MVLKPEDFDFLSHGDTVWAVVLGAMLATLGGFVATHLERAVVRRERQRDLALFFGEVLSTLAVIVEMAGETRSRGEPYGAVTMRILRTARREVDVYERNRERLFDLHDGALRTRIHALVARLTLPLDGVFDAMRELSELQARLAASAVPAEEAAADRARLEERRKAAFDLLLEAAAQLGSVVTRLEPLARQSFREVGTIARNA